MYKGFELSFAFATIPIAKNIFTISINDTIEAYEKLLYSSKEGDFYIKKQLVDGTYESLFGLEYINFENDNVMRIPPNKDCTIKLTADEDIQSATITIYVYYISV